MQNCSSKFIDLNTKHLFLIIRKKCKQSKTLILFLVAKATQKVLEFEFLVCHTFQTSEKKNISELQAFRSSLFQILLGPLYAAASGCQPYHTSCCHILL